MSEAKSFFHYLPVNDAAIRWGTYLTGAGRTTIRAGQGYPPGGHPGLYDFQWARGRTLPEFALILVTEGQGTFESLDTECRVIEPGSVILVLPGKWHRYRPSATTGWTERWMTFNGEVAHRLVPSLGLPETCAIGTIRNPEHLLSRFDELLERIHFHPTQNSVLLSMHGMALLAEVLEYSALLPRQRPQSIVLDRDNIDDELVHRAREQVWTHSHRALSVAQIARELGVTRRTLERRFVAAVGTSVLADITACRLSRAKRLLEETDLPVKTIAGLAGFPSDEQMRVTFCKSVGLCPSKYRERSRSREHRRPRSTRSRS